MSFLIAIYLISVTACFIFKGIKAALATALVVPALIAFYREINLFKKSTIYA